MVAGRGGGADAWIALPGRFLQSRTGGCLFFPVRFLYDAGGVWYAPVCLAVWPFQASGISVCGTGFVVNYLDCPADWKFNAVWNIKKVVPLSLNIREYI